MKMVRLIRDKWNNASVRLKMLTAFFIPIVLIIVMNVYMYIGINTMISKVDEIYVSNVSLNELSEELTALHNSTREFLESKSTSALNDYYKADQAYRDRLDTIHGQGYDNSMIAMSDNIYNQSQYYLKVVSDSVAAKRGRNVEKYKAGYEESQIIYNDLQNCIYSLNSNQFKMSTDNYSALLSSLRLMEIITIVILVIIAFVNLIVVFLITRSMTLPLADLSHAADEVARGNFEIDFATPEGNDEVSVVSRAFKQMVESIQKYIETIKESVKREGELKEHELVMESRMKEVQLRSLQAQINPHFLFNTLNAGEQLAMMEGADKTTEFIENMADFFRYNIKKIDNDASVAEEIELVDKYIYILNVRFAGEIQYTKDVDPIVNEIRVPSMILQPIVENAVNYGIRDIDWEGHIDLKAYNVGENVFLSIKDNGVGMEQNHIDRILSGEAFGEVSEHHSASNGIGLGNVIERLQIFTGRSDVIDIKSDGIGKGTEFIIKVPMHN